MIGETILARKSAQCKQAYNWRDNVSLIIGLQSASWWSVNIYCANYWPTISAPIIVPPILARLSAALLNSANPTWDAPNCRKLKETRKVCCRVLGFHRLITSEHSTHTTMLDAHLTIFCFRVLGFHRLITSQHPTHTPRCFMLAPRFFVSEFPGHQFSGDRFSRRPFFQRPFFQRPFF